MSEAVSAVGDMVVTGLAARALDAPTPHGEAHGRPCLNCGATLDGHFCAACGQRADVHRSLLHVGEELLHGITHFDGKAWKTLPMLVVRPGKLTRDYVYGKRARYIAPVSLFLLVVFLMFLVFGLIDFKPVNLQQAMSPNGQAIADLDREIAKAKAAGKTADVRAMEATRAGMVAIRDRAATGEGLSLTETLGEMGRASDLKVDTGVPAIDSRIRHALANPELILYKIQGKAYKLSFLLVPMSLPWLWLAFVWKRGVRVYDHAVFALYSLSFMSLLFIAGSLAYAAGVESGLFWFALIFLVPPVHMFAQLKGAYALGNFSAAWRTLYLAWAAVSTLIIYALTIAALGVLD